MDVFSALQTAVSGLKAQAYSLDNISGNIANSQTTGYKRIDTSFNDIVAEQDAKHQVAGTVAAQSQLTNSLQGTFNATGIGTNMALNGSGFFIVQRKTSDVAGATTFSGEDLYTRRGDFSLDKDGYLVNGAGSYLQGARLDPSTGQTTANGPIQVSNSVIPAKATTTITYSANLPKTPTTAASATTAGGTPPTALADIPQTGAQTFINNSIAGPSITAYTSGGAPMTLQMRWAKVSTADPATPGSTDTWNLYYADKSSVSGSSTSWTNLKEAFTFDASAQLTAPATGSVNIAKLSVDGIEIPDVALNFGKGGLTQYASSSGSVTTNALKQDGYASGTLNSVAVTSDGKVSGTYSNGSVYSLAKINVAQFINPDGLKAASNGNYTQTMESGVPVLGLKDTTVLGANVEQSNTDIAGEFSKMIVTQQAYTANTRVMTTAQTMISDLLNVIR